MTHLSKDACFLVFNQDPLPPSSPPTSAVPQAPLFLSLFPPYGGDKNKEGGGGKTCAKAPYHVEIWGKWGGGRG